MSNRRSALLFSHAAASFRAPRTGPSARAFLGRWAGRVDGAGAPGHSPRNRDTRAGRPRRGRRNLGARRWVITAARDPPVGGIGAHPGGRTGESGPPGRRHRAGKANRRGGGATPRADSRARRCGALLWAAPAGPGGRGVPRPRPGEPEPDSGGPAHHAGHSEQLAGASAGSVPGGDCRGGGGDHRGAQSSEWRPDALGRRSRGHAPAGRCGARVGHAGVRSCGDWGRSRRGAVREFRGGRPVVTSTAPILAPELAKAVAAQRDRLDLDVLSRAYRISAQAHQGQKRMSGDDFVSHSVAVATILAEQQMDTTTIAAALLHDVVEDSDVTLELLRRDFGNEVADLVDGLTKIKALNFRSTAEEQAENYRKLLMSVARDARVIIIKLADRLHNMRTLDPLPADKRKRIALETRELDAPLAHRFGMAGVKAELEDLSFKYLEPDDYKQLAKQVTARRVERDRTIERMRAPLSDELRRASIVGWEIVGRPKNLWSIFKKMKKRGKPFEEIYDLLAVRVLVKDRKSTRLNSSHPSIS